MFTIKNAVIVYAARNYLGHSRQGAHFLDNTFSQPFSSYHIPSSWSKGKGIRELEVDGSNAVEVSEPPSS